MDHLGMRDGIYFRLFKKGLTEVQEGATLLSGKRRQGVELLYHHKDNTFPKPLM